MPTLEQLKAEHPERCWKCGDACPTAGGLVRDYHVCGMCHTDRLLAALTAAKLEDEATIAELDSRLATVQEVLHFRESVRAQLRAEQQAHAATKEELRKADETIQQQARELEEADFGLLHFHQWFVRHSPPGVEYSDRLFNAFVAAKQRHSARAQQADAAKEE